MTLIAYYVVFVAVGEVGAYFVGRAVEATAGSTSSLTVFLALFFLVFWASWRLAVKVT